MEESARREIQLANVSTNNEDQNTQTEANISGGNENKEDSLVIEIRGMVEGPEIQYSSERCCIYKVPPQLRKRNEEAYTPQVISIGPFHSKNARLKTMEVHKGRYLRSFVKRSKIKLEYLVGKIKEMEDKIRFCYAEVIDLTSDMFVKMILVDACFILELFFRRRSESLTKSTSSLVGEARAAALKVDLLLLENQLPFFVLEELHQLAFPSLSNADPCLSNYDILLKLSISYFKFRDSNIQFIQKAHSNVKIEYFTDLIRTFQLPPPENLPKRGNDWAGLSYTATQLHEAGVKFEVVTSECRFDIKFEDGVLKIPMLELNHWTEVVTRNIMALEQTRYLEDGHFTDYFLFIDSLINTREDVDLLCNKNILVNHLGDNNAATSMINDLNKGILLMPTREDYVDLCNKLNSFYKEPWHSWKATLRRQYFSTPWRAASIVAAIILLVLTFIQTACSIIK
nr:UPF0481 protein At3g47200-like [Quercus suber]